jgi:hypothetical protein
MRANPPSKRRWRRISNCHAAYSTNLVHTNYLCYGVGEDIDVSFDDAFPHPHDWVAIYELAMS